jgi:membrane-bound metal-dependent hydrolase YbcI (DUF457 family)
MAWGGMGYFTVGKSEWMEERDGMMGKTHAATGAAVWLVGSSVAALLGHSLGVYEIAVGTPLAAFGAILPDIDCPSSSIANSFGYPTRWLARRVAWAGKRIHAATRTPLDRPDLDGHRTASHTFLFVLLTFVGFGWLGTHGSVLAVAAMTAFAAATALRALRVHGAGRYLAAAAVAAAGWWWPAPSGWWLGWAIGAGALIHNLGDRQTNTGVPLAWPIKIRGRRWYKFRAAKWMRFETGADGNPEGVIRWMCGLVSTLAAAGMVYVRWPEQVHAVVDAVAVSVR